jgi:gamma-tubulin complex component 2
MKTCVTFAFYTRTFAKSAAVAVQDGGGGEEEMQKMFKFLSSFEKSFDYWCVQALCLGAEQDTEGRSIRLPKYLDYARFYASSDNVALLPLVVRLTSINP